MRSTKELYGTDPKVLKDMKYLEALKRKRQDARDYIDREMSKDYMTRDTHEINRKIKAIKFTDKLIDEVKDA